MTRTPEQRVQLAREFLRSGEPLPDWSVAEWVQAIVAKLGLASMSMHPDSGGGLDASGRVTEFGLDEIAAVAGVCMDMIEALGEEGAGDDARK